MAYPSVISSFTNPQATDKLNSPSHSSIEAAQNTDLTAIETFIGTLSSTQGTLIYDIRAAASNGGGHVQSANTGGTGQTSYTKGDLLIASSSSVLSKLAVGTNTYALIADSTQSVGMKWAAVLSTGWTSYNKTTLSSQAIATTWSSLPAHDRWLLVFALNGGANNGYVGLRLNNDSSTSNYAGTTFGTTGSSLSGDSAMRLVNMGAATAIGGWIEIQGLRQGGHLLVNASLSSNGTQSTLTRGDYTAAADLTRIDILDTNASTNWSGTMELYYQDF